MLGSGDLKQLKRLTDRLSPLLPEWDARIMNFKGQQAVVLDTYPSQIDRDGGYVSVGMLELLTIQDGQWWARTFMLTADGPPVPDPRPAQPIGARSGDIDGAVRRIVSVSVTAYRNAAKYEPTGVPEEDALFLGWRPHARHVLERLTNDRFM